MKTLLPATLAVFTAGCLNAPLAVAQEANEARTITVTGNGETAARPDIAMITIGVRSEGATAAAALSANNANMAATLKSLKDAGIADRDIQTSGLSINPQYNYERNRSNPEVTGFVASNTVNVRLRDLDKAGSVIDTAVRAGANSLGGIQFGFDDPKEMEQQALRNAVAAAKAKAELLTDAAGVDLGEVLTINASYSVSPQPRPMMARAEAVSDEMAIEAGESTVAASVTIVYEIE